MNRLLRFVLLAGCGAVAAALTPGCTKAPPIAFVAAPPGPADLGPATGLTTPPAGAVVFDLKYRAETGGADDIQYHSYWGYGGMNEETKTNAFLAEVRAKASRLHYVYNVSFKGRKWAAVEYQGQQAQALYFDLDADGKLGPNERISPTRAADDGVEFILPDFIQPLDGGGQTLCRALLKVNFYGGNSEPNSMWSPAALLDGTATLNGKTKRLLLFVNRPGGRFDEFSSSSFALLAGDKAKIPAGEYISRETLSSLITIDDQFYRLSFDGRRSNGLPARVLLVKDTTPTGQLAVRMSGSNSLPSSVASLYLKGAEDKTICFHVAGKDKVTLPQGTYSIASGTASYGMTNAEEWEVAFSQGPTATVRAGETSEEVLGQPVLTVRAVEERNRWDPQAAELTSFKKGTRIYLEPKIIGKGGEIFGRFRQATAGKADKANRPPKITITAPDGKPVLSTVMEYG